MNLSITSIIAISCSTVLWAEPVVLTGNVGPYQIEAEIDRAGDSLMGRYRYAGRDSWLDLTGAALAQDAVQLDGFASDAQTGALFLDMFDGQMSGFWARGEVKHPAQLLPVSGTVDDLLDPPDVIAMDASLTGKYLTGLYWANEWSAPHFKIGFNGGDVNVVQVYTDLILVNFRFIVGPTYHFASFQGFARRVDEMTFVHDAIFAGGDVPCRLQFTFDDAQLAISDHNNGFACQFGMRAHANFRLPKVSDIAEFTNQW